MTPAKTAFTLINKQTGSLAFKVFSFNNNHDFDHIQRLNYFSLIWIKEGSGQARVDFSEYEFKPNSMFAFSPYQPFMFTSSEIQGVAIHFHSDFFCIFKHHKEISCNGLLFNNIYSPPFINVDTPAAVALNLVVEQIKSEMQQPALAQTEILVSYLKIFLINATRIKAQSQNIPLEVNLKEPFILQNLKNAIEEHFKTRHSASSYADLLNISPKALAKITKSHFNKTLTEMISERIMIEAKRELYLTDKPVKAIANDLGYDDEHYFSRFFKVNADISPQVYRTTVGFGRENVA